ncbi:unnamed protein product [Rhizoctonia solani]|uniref:AB hydrolase-1 domain-containing protein n=1 Tax=Rhizoctonia solani TaxID=456999 RepID=A0A8H2XL79_9AGAM|nr:unnamed protein product [Rhizoctonia solani]
MASAYYVALFATLASLTVAHASVIPLPDGYHRDPPRNNHLEWKNCSVENYPGRECTRFEVPLDWHKAAVGKASLAVIRYPAMKSPKLGTLFMNPGGPGGSGVDTVQSSFGDQLMQESGGQYDLVSKWEFDHEARIKLTLTGIPGWDPRGVGKSTPHTRCFGTFEEQTAFWNGSFIQTGVEAKGEFTSQADLDLFYGQVGEVDDLLTRFGKQCLEYNPNALQYIGTAATVRDIVAIHDVIEGPGKAINYWGISYGTLLGNTFVNMFPDRVGRVMLDGVVNPIYYTSRPSYQVRHSAYTSDGR